MCDAGAIAMSRDTGHIPGFGEVIGKSWKLGRISQEHGTLVRIPPNPEAGHIDPILKVGDIIGIVGQHACLIAAAHQWFYIIDSDTEEGTDKVVDIWVPWKGWLVNLNRGLYTRRITCIIIDSKSARGPVVRRGQCCHTFMPAVPLS
ncbi:hypothetical protein K503DRAFT_859386 [Rhizopogon vinicolor AM-OR11-026]|uniref:D-serine dehydratase-like domain-containing protein n=1 Tax=Rhizopogon vinicolor AM-OR11-026 TaxID=1314800 RepID=A0A1B7MNF3_9AGAM|nr:hypothetical protein K503DRAFT_859386 [Rhizopogon vinicolor AM-OR11-026]